MKPPLSGSPWRKLEGKDRKRVIAALARDYGKGTSLINLQTKYNLGRRRIRKLLTEGGVTIAAPSKHRRKQ